MAEAAAPLPTRPPWTLRLYDAAPLPPWLVGVAIAATCFTIYLAGAWALGWVEALRASGDFVLILRLELLQAVLIGYVPTAAAYAVRGAERDLGALRPALDLSDAAFAREQRALGEFSPRALAICGVAGIAYGLYLPFSDTYWVGARPPLGDSVLSWNLLRVTLLSWLVTRTLYVETHLALRFSQLGRRARVDLLDLAPLAPFSRRALGGVLRLMLFFACFSLFLLTPFTATLTLVTLGLVACTALTVFLLPVGGVHRRIVQVKRDELARVRAAIRHDREALLEGDAERSRLSHLLAYEGRVSEAGTWPFDVSTWLRLGLYLTLGLGSWLGGALVERLVDTALG